MFCSISGHGRQPSIIFVFSTCQKRLSSQFFDLDIENPLGRGNLAKFALDTHMGVDLLDQKFEWRYRDLVGRRWHFCMPGHRLILRPLSKSGGALPARYTHCCICACPCSAYCRFGSLLWGE